MTLADLIGESWKKAKRNSLIYCLNDTWDSFRYVREKRLSDERRIWARLQSAEYSTDDLQEFMDGLGPHFYEEPVAGELSQKAIIGIFVSLAAERLKEREICIRTEHGLDYIGFGCTKRLQISGKVGDYLGYRMKDAVLEVTGTGKANIAHYSKNCDIRLCGRFMGGPDNYIGKGAKGIRLHLCGDFDFRRSYDFNEPFTLFEGNWHTP